MFLDIFFLGLPISVYNCNLEDFHHNAVFICYSARFYEVWKNSFF